MALLPLIPKDLTPTVLFEDANLMVINKPAGLLSQGDHTGRPSLVDWAREVLGRPYVGLIHRLDTNTSGIMLVAKRTKAAERLTRALQEDRIQRTYVALVSGRISAPARWEHFLVKNEKTNQTRAYAANDPAVSRIPGAKRAALTVQPLASGPGDGEILATTWIQVFLETGRSHQIRAQSEAMGHAIIGDPKYGGAKNSGRGSQTAFADRLGLHRPALHSWTLDFEHPVGEAIKMSFVAPLAEDLAKVLGAAALRPTAPERSDL